MGHQTVVRTGLCAISIMFLSDALGYGQVIRVRTDHAANLRSYRSFCLGQLTQEPTHTESVVQTSVAAELTRMGLQQQANTCDVVIITSQKNAMLHQAQEADGSGGASSTVYFGPYASGGTVTQTHLTWNGWGNSDLISSSSAIPGTELDMEMIDLAQRKVVFQGAAFAKTSDCNRVSSSKREKCEARNEKASQKAMQKLLKNYPKT